MKGHTFKYVVIVVFLVIIDQITKGVIQNNFSVGESISVISGFFSITYVRNPGAAFGFLASAPDFIRKPLFLLIPVLACFWLVYLIWQSRKKELFQGVCYSLILAGAIGNLIDRFTLDYVVDFLDFYYSTHHYPAFNVADSCISVAAVLLLIEFAVQLKKKKA